MSLDTVELVMEIEERFDIVIRDDDAPNMVTMGDVYRYILDKRNCLENGFRCGSAQVFYQLRRALTNGLGIARDRIRPASMLDDFFPRSDRRRLWTRLGETVGFSLPKLRRPNWLVRVLGLCVAVVFLLCLRTFAAMFVLGEPWLIPSAILAVLPTLGFALLVRDLTAPFAIEFGRDVSSVRGLIGALRQLNNATFPSSVGNRSDVWETLVDIVVEQTGVEREFLTSKTSFVDDLGMD